jgi:hypothetical protein
MNTATSDKGITAQLRKRSASDGHTSGSLWPFLLGAWNLRSYVEVPESGAAERYPLGPDAKGTLIYSPDGYMSVQIMRCGRSPFASGDWFSPTDAELRDAAAFIAYSGPFSVNEKARTVTHTVEVSFFPNWLRRMEVRNAKMGESELILVPHRAIRSGGNDVKPQLRWSRVSPGTPTAEGQ